MNTSNTTPQMTDMLHEVGTPLNEAAKHMVFEKGNPLYCVSSLPYSDLYPFISDQAHRLDLFESIWNEAVASIEEFYLNAFELQQVPVWRIDEIALNAKRDGIVSDALARFDDVAPCFLDRVLHQKDATRLHVNRTLQLNNGVVDRDDRPSILAERPGFPAISDQLSQIVSECRSKGRTRVMLVDSGFASGNTMLKICSKFEFAGMKVEKVIGGVGSYPTSYNLLKEYNPECVIWFDLQKSGWVESRDYFTFLNTGTPISYNDKNSGESRIKRMELVKGLDIGFSIPYIAYGGRWFRLGDAGEIKRLMERCFDFTLRLYEAFKPNVTIEELARIYTYNGGLFLLPVNFGNLEAQRSRIEPSTRIVDYLDKNFSSFLQ